MPIKSYPPYKQWLREQFKRQNIDERQAHVIAPIIDAFLDRVVLDVTTHFTIGRDEVDAMKLERIPEGEKDAYRRGCKYMIEYLDQEIKIVKEQFGLEGVKTKSQPELRFPLGKYTEEGTHLD